MTIYQTIDLKTWKPNKKELDRQTLREVKLMALKRVDRLTSLGKAEYAIELLNLVDEINDLLP